MLGDLRLGYLGVVVPEARASGSFLEAVGGLEPGDDPKT